MFSKSIIYIVSLTLLSTLTLYADMDEAKEMVEEAACMKCHVPAHFQHREKKVNSYKKLSNSVRACATSSGAGWFDEDSDIVTEYLNKKHYHYQVPPKEEEE